MFPHERSLVKQLAGKPFALIGVNSDKDLERARNAVEKKELNWRSFWNGEKGTMGPISIKWSVYTWPTLYVIDAKGVIRFKNVRGEELDQAITDLLAEAGHAVEISHEAQEAELKKTADPKSTDPAQTNDEAAQKG